MTARARPHPPEQLVLALPGRQAQEAEDFLVSHSNAAAVELIDSWPAWPLPAHLVVGPEGAGKSHLANVWRLASGAPVAAAGQLGEGAVEQFEAGRRLVVEDIDRGICNEKVLFHLLNLAREKRGALLLTSRVPPGEIGGLSVPDLRSRLRAIPPVTIAPPDEALLRSVLVKLFSDRQLLVEPHVVSYLALHMERSMEAATRLVAACDRLSLAMQRKVTRAVAAEALAEDVLDHGDEEAD